MSGVSLVAEGVEFRYPQGPSGRRAGFSVGPVSLHLGPGLYHLRGRNGAGKTTLLRCLCGGLRPSAGRVLVNGRDVSQPQVRRDVALLPGRPSLPTFLTVDEAWRLLSGLRGAPAWDGRPYREALGVPGALKLTAASDGQARKAELVAALAGDPTVLLLDEPLALMDAAAVAQIGAWIEGWRRQRVLLVTSHEALPWALDGEAELSPGQPLLDWRPARGG